MSSSEMPLSTSKSGWLRKSHRGKFSASNAVDRYFVAKGFQARREREREREREEREREREREREKKNSKF